MKASVRSSISFFNLDLEFIWPLQTFIYLGFSYFLGNQLPHGLPRHLSILNKAIKVYIWPFERGRCYVNFSAPVTPGVHPLNSKIVNQARKNDSVERSQRGKISLNWHWEMYNTRDFQDDKYRQLLPCYSLMYVRISARIEAWET